MEERPGEQLFTRRDGRSVGRVPAASSLPTIPTKPTIAHTPRQQSALDPIVKIRVPKLLRDGVRAVRVCTPHDAVMTTRVLGRQFRVFRAWRVVHPAPHSRCRVWPCYCHCTSRSML